MKQPAAGDQDGCKLTMGTHPQDRLPVVSNSNIVFASRQMNKKKKKDVSSFGAEHRSATAFLCSTVEMRH